MNRWVFCVFYGCILAALAACSNVEHGSKHKFTSHGFTYSDDCRSVGLLSNPDTELPGLYCLVRDLDDGPAKSKGSGEIGLSLSGGHRVAGVGALYVTKSDIRVDMRGFGVWTNRHDRGGVWIDGLGKEINNVKVMNGILYGVGDAFSIGGVFWDLPDTAYLDEHTTYSCGMGGEGLAFENMAISGGAGSVISDGATIKDSGLMVNVINVRGIDFNFIGNSYVVAGGGDYIIGGVKRLDSFLFMRETPLRLEKVSGTSINKYNHAAGLYLSCADNAVIDGNIFSSLKGRPEVPAIVLKRSRNVRITNNTFEGFAMPVLMDKYSSIIDSSGNIIKPDITAENPASLLYKLKLEPRPVGTQTKAQPQLKSG